ncbi:D-alanine--D-alanine ligase [Thermostichus vulcanus]|uniref:D-alanine--D-alanine ligase n=1 Tax=Thermostichus vulcanus str. 'Rupite' TaxID=2813851 RepID=A0ABT0CBB2_THEVL|nr:D-alanine--D-alanine ligase [Thermostichus vulcanus]MCJ2543066.1 D-alanine--D-alanine ligase [Thermostichus vulcanus str. 'Rupite']
MRIVVLAGGRSSERQVSWVTGKACKRALEDLGHQVKLIDPEVDLPLRLWQEREAGCDFVWIALHGPGGEDGVVQGMLDWLGLPYQGSGRLASALAMDKLVSKQIFQTEGIPTPEWIAWDNQAPLPWAECVAALGSPLVIKPSNEGSTVGISIVEDEPSFTQGLQLARSVSSRILLERYIPGKEITLSILSGQILPAIEIIPAQGSFYDYEAKYAPGGSRHIIPCSLSPAGLARCEAAGLRAYQALGCEGLARVDLRVDAAENPWVLEVNTLPGMTPTSLCPDAAAALGWTFTELVERMLQEALQKASLTPAARTGSPLQESQN